MVPSPRTPASISTTSIVWRSWSATEVAIWTPVSAASIFVSPTKASRGRRAHWAIIVSYSALKRVESRASISPETSFQAWITCKSTSSIFRWAWSPGEPCFWATASSGCKSAAGILLRFWYLKIWPVSVRESCSGLGPLLRILLPLISIACSDCSAWRQASASWYCTKPYALFMEICAILPYLWKT